jgi:hypothetical protein
VISASSLGREGETPSARKPKSIPNNNTSPTPMPILTRQLNGGWFGPPALGGGAEVCELRGSSCVMVSPPAEALSDS